MIPIKYKFLVLTDHSAHSVENSLYALTEELRTHVRCKYIDVATRGSGYNRTFFDSLDRTLLRAVRIKNRFVFDPSGKQFYSNVKNVSLADYDVILMRLPRPISDHFLYWLDEKTRDQVVINQPKGIVETSNKAFLSNFPGLCPPMKLCRSILDIIEFSKKFPLVLKPLREYGGKGIIKLEKGMVHDGDEYFPEIEYLRSIEEQIINEGYLAMKFLKNVNKGDKRILVAGGEIMAATLRCPPDGSWLCNVARGGSSSPSDVTIEEREIVGKIDRILQEKGILIYGVDTLVDDSHKRVLSEINTLSTGGIMQAQSHTGLPILKKTAMKIIEYVDKKYGRSSACSQ